jgi:PAS domain S-box-containing protein
MTKRKRAEEVQKPGERAALRLARETGVIAEIGRIISSTLDIEEVYERFAKEVSKLIPFDRIVVNLVNTREGTATIAYASGVEIEGRERRGVFPLAGTSMEEMVRTRAPLLFYPESVEEVRRPGLVLALEAGLRSRLLVPLIARGEVIGGLSLWSKQKKAYGERDIRLAQSVASQIAGAMANARLFSERKQVEKALRESEESYRSLVETSPDAIFLHDEDLFVYLNPAAVRLFGAGSAEELYGKNAFDIIHPDDKEAIRNRTELIMTTGVSVPVKEIKIVRRDGSTVDVEAAAGVSYYRGKKVIQVIQRDITERKRAEKELQKERQTFFTILENDPTGVALIGKDGTYQYLNPEFTDITGYSLQDIRTGKEWFEKAYPDPHYRQKVIDAWKMDRLSHGRKSDRGFTITCKDGQKKEIEFRTTSLTDYSVVVLNDVTEQKRAEEKIKASLREKEVLLKEIHHRVKNNLQIISSLLYLQATRTEHPGAISALRESRDRVRSMALVHEGLYASPNLASIDMGRYVRSLVSELRRSYITEDSSVRLTVNVGDISLGITEAIPCGLIINELVSNALKHAFPKGRDGEIRIELFRGAANQVMLTVSDSGIGFPEQMDFRKSPSLGLTLINSLVEQLGGTIEFDRSKGTAFAITFG